MRTALDGAGLYPAPIEVLIGADWVEATSHATRTGRHGQQVLITHHGHLMWVAAHRVRPRDTDAGAAASSASGRGCFA